MLFGLLALNDSYIIGFSNLLTMNVPDDGYSRNASVSTVLLALWPWSVVLSGYSGFFHH